MAVLSIKLSKGGFTADITGLDSSYAQNNRYIEWYVYEGTSVDPNYHVGSNITEGGIGANITQITNLYINCPAIDGGESGKWYTVEALIHYTKSLDPEQWGTSVLTATAFLKGSGSGGGGGTTQKPDLFEWDSPKVSGEAFNLTAGEWNRLTAKINEWCEYKGRDTHQFTKAESGKPFTADMYAEARDAIDGLTNLTMYYPVKGGTVMAYYLTELSVAINNIS